MPNANAFFLSGLLILSAVVLVEVFVYALKFSIVYGKQMPNKTKLGFLTEPCSTNLMSVDYGQCGTSHCNMALFTKVNSAARIRVMHSLIHLNQTQNSLI